MDRWILYFLLYKGWWDGGDGYVCVIQMLPPNSGPLDIIIDKIYPFLLFTVSRQVSLIVPDNLYLTFLRKGISFKEYLGQTDSD